MILNRVWDDARDQCMNCHSTRLISLYLAGTREVLVLRVVVQDSLQSL